MVKVIEGQIMKHIAGACKRASIQYIYICPVQKASALFLEILMHISINLLSPTLEQQRTSYHKRKY
jgi:hypothetical protein